MKRVALAAIGFGAAVTAAAPPLAAEPTCEPVAIVDGDPALVASLQSRLVERGIAIDEATPDACPAVRATVVRDGAAVRITVIEPSGAAVARDVTTEEIAATWIESRVRMDVGAPLLAARVPVAVPRGGAAPGAAPSPAAADTMMVAVAAPRRDPLSIAVAIESSFAGDGTDWRSYSLAACARIGPLCVGALGRLGDNEASVHDDMFIIAKRSSRDLLLTASLPIRGRTFTIAPNVGAGVGWMRTRQVGEPLFGPDTCTDPTVDGTCELPEPINEATRGLRLAAGVTVSLPINARVAFDFGVTGELLAGGHTELYVRDNPFDGMADGSDGYTDDFFEYPGEPDRFFRAGIGLRIGLP